MAAPDALVGLWPAAGVRVGAGDLELRWIDDDLLVELAQLAARGIHDPGGMPFLVPWTRGAPDEVARSVVAYQWSARTVLGPERVALELAVLDRGVPVGIQGMSAAQWASTHVAGTGSWLGRGFQGRGIGTRMRALMLHLLFHGLGAREVTSDAFADNPASNGVSRRLGYEALDDAVVEREGGRVVQRRYRMTRERWGSLRSEHAALLGGPVRLEGAEPLRAHLDRTP